MGRKMDGGTRLTGKEGRGLGLCRWGGDCKTLAGTACSNCAVLPPVMFPSHRLFQSPELSSHFPLLLPPSPSPPPTPHSSSHSNYAVGYNNVKVPEATKRGIPVGFRVSLTPLGGSTRQSHPSYHPLPSYPLIPPTHPFPPPRSVIPPACSPKPPRSLRPH